MAIAAGDTPSPEMVAAAGTDVRIRPEVAWGLVAVAAAGIVVTAWLSRDALVYQAGAPRRPLEVMADNARELLDSVGADESLDSAWSVSPNHSYLTYMASGLAADPVAGMAAHGVEFWYRESPVTLERTSFLTGPELLPRIMTFDPPLKYSGEWLLRFDRQGRLVSLTGVPPQRPDTQPGGEVDWALLFRAAGLDIGDWAEVESEWTPLFHADRRFAWRPRQGEPDAIRRVEAASFQGRPVSFAVVFPWTTAERQLATRRTPGERVGNLILVLTLSGTILASALLARRNLRLERGDSRGASRIAAVVATLLMILWVIDEEHVASIWELYLFLMAAGWALLMGALTAVFYLALEPYVRRNSGQLIP